VARIRTLKPEFLTDSKTGTLSDRAAKLFIGLLIYADDYGVVRFDVDEFRARIFPYVKGDPVSKPLFDELLPRGLVVYFTVDATGYLWIPKFMEHQRVDRPSKPVLPGWDEAPDPEAFALLVGVEINRMVEPNIEALDEDSTSARRSLALEGRERKGYKTLHCPGEAKCGVLRGFTWGCCVNTGAPANCLRLRGRGSRRGRV
jgi:hypothetical protein